MQAMQQLGVSNPEELIYTDPTKYEQYIATKARIEYQAEMEQQQHQVLFNQNVAFINELKTTIPNLDVVIAFATEELQSMPFKEVFPIDSAYTRVGQGIGTAEDFKVVKDFAQKCLAKMNTPSVVEQAKEQIAEQAKALPKASALSGATGGGTEMTWEKAMELYLNGQVDAIPQAMRKQFEEI